MSHLPTSQRLASLIGIVLLSATTLTACKHGSDNNNNSANQGNQKPPVMDCAPK